MNRFLSLAALLLAALSARPVLAWNDEPLAAPLAVNGVQVPYRRFSVFVMPGESLKISVPTPGDASVCFRGECGPVGSFVPRAPDEPGVEPLSVELGATGETALVQVFTLVPAHRVSATGVLNGYQIGRYPEKPLRGLAIYRPPAGYVEVTEATADLFVSPNFRLGQFLCKQQGGFPRYVVLRPGLLIKLEIILEELNAAGRPTDGLVVMSGYRTPFYNRAIGNVPYSRHAWGGAADIYVDEAPADGVMDDLDGNGRLDRGDAEWLADFIEGLSRKGRFGSRIGGLGIYGANSAHGPFVHVDVRGSRARW